MTLRAGTLLMTLAALAAPAAAQLAEDVPWPWAQGSWWHVTIDGAGGDGRARLEAALGQLAVGSAARARALLRDTLTEEALRAPALAIDAQALAALNRPAEAAAQYEAAAALARGAAVGVLRARAGAAWETAGNRERARAAYQAAMVDAPDMAPWLAFRAARAADTPDAPALTTDAPPGAERLARTARADILVRLGDTARAVDALIAASRPAMAARLVLGTGDSVSARALAYAALETPDTAEVAAGQRLVTQRFPPTRAHDYLALARAAERLRDTRGAASWTAAARRAGDSSAATALLLGDRQDRAGDRPAAIVSYGHAGPTGAFRAARLRLRLRDTRGARAALTRFLADHGDHPSAPVAAYLLADLNNDHAALAAVAERWPTHDIASRVRVELAEGGLRRADTAAARAWYRAEITHTARAFSAIFLLGRLDRQVGDTAAWYAAMQDLAARDPLGFHGYAARQAAGLQPLDYAVTPGANTDPAVAEVLRQIDLLDAAGFDDEATLLLAEATRRVATDAAAGLDLAEGLVQRQRAPEAIALGWQINRLLPMTHPRLVRVLFPWPERELVLAEAHKFGLNPWLMAGLIRQESSFRTRAVSRAGARGLMQLMPATAREVARRQGVPWTDAHRGVPDANVHVGAAHLAALLRQFDGEVPVALAAYNAGGTPTRRWRRRAGSADPVEFVESITYAETRDYVRAVVRNAALYQLLYPDP